MFPGRPRALLSGWSASSGLDACEQLAAVKSKSVRRVGHTRNLALPDQKSSRPPQVSAVVTVSPSRDLIAIDLSDPFP